MSDLDYLLGARKKGRGAKAPSARFDAAQTTDENRAHWSSADGLSAIAANTPEVRRILRNRSRYEDGNNSQVNGLVRDHDEDTVGTCPRLQLIIPGPDVDFDVPLPADISREVETRWKKWAEAAGLPDILHTTVATEDRDGEVFTFFHVNPKLPDPVHLALRLYEGDQIATPSIAPTQLVDGIEFDEYGNPEWYHVLKQHPGDLGLIWQPAGEFDRVPARQMIHLFEARRPGQARGIPIFTPSLPIYSVLRRWTNACLLSAEAQARITAVIEQEHDLGEDEDDGAGEQIQYAGVHMLTLASGQKAKGLQHSSPPQNYKEFKAEGLTDGGRPLSAPRNVSTGSSAEYNYSSGRLDQQRWHRSIRVRRERLERLVLNRILREWAAFAFTIPGYLPPGTPPVEKWSWCWRWDGFTSIDPVKDAKAATERLTNGTSSLDRECGELGEDWEDVQDQRLAEELREHRRRKELGLPEKAERQQGQRQPAPVEDDEDA
jgi:lambda family phage portal protein